MSELCIIAFGGNLGDVPATFLRAAFLLEIAGFQILRFSSCYTTSPVDCPCGTPDFTNAVASGYWSGTPEKLLDACQKTEVECGRPHHHEHHVSRTLDLDIILFGEHVIRNKRLIIPHPEAKFRDFVTIPLKEIAPDLLILLNRLTDDDMRNEKSRQIS